MRHIHNDPLHLETSNSHTNPSAFHLDREYVSANDAWKNAWNEKYWKFGITISQGNGMTVSQSELKRRLNYTRLRLLRGMGASNARKREVKIQFFVFPQGSTKDGSMHYHSFMGIEGNGKWSDFRIAMTLRQIEYRRPKGSEKPAHIDWDWKKGNAFHSYCARDHWKDPEAAFIM